MKSTQSRYIGIWKRKSGRAYKDDSRIEGLGPPAVANRRLEFGHHCHGDVASYGNDNPSLICRLIAAVPTIPHAWQSSWPEPQYSFYEGAVELLPNPTATFDV